MGLKDKAAKLTSRIVRAVTAALLTLGLFLIYFVGLPFTFVLAVFLSPRRVFGRGRRREPRWLEVDKRGHAPDMDEALRQS